MTTICSFYGLPPWVPTYALFNNLFFSFCLRVGQQENCRVCHHCLAGIGSSVLLPCFKLVGSRTTRGSAQQLLVISFWPGTKGRSTIKFFDVKAVLMLQTKTPFPQPRARTERDSHINHIRLPAPAEMICTCQNQIQIQKIFALIL